MRSGKGGMAVTVVVVGYTAAMALVAVVIATAGDSNALGMLLLFGPRWLLVFPWLLLVPLAFVASRWVALTAAVGAVVTLFWVSGFEIPVPSAIWRMGGVVRPLRIVTYNTDRSASLASRIAVDMMTWDADVIVMQDCAPEVGAAMKAEPFPGTPYEVFLDSEFCIATRLPLRSPVQLDGTRKDGRALQFVVTWQGTPVQLATVHLPSPRNALWAARKGSTDLLEQSVRVRSGASRAATHWILRPETPAAVIVAGDFNVPAEAQVLREDWAPLRNAFSEAGWGFGHTMFAGRHRVRIDHVLVSEAFSVRGARVLSGYPSEHQPVVADVTLESR